MRLVLDTWNIDAVERALVIAALKHEALEAASFLGVSDKRLERLLTKHKLRGLAKRERARARKALSNGAKAP